MHARLLRGAQGRGPGGRKGSEGPRNPAWSSDGGLALLLCVSFVFTLGKKNKTRFLSFFINLYIYIWQKCQRDDVTTSGFPVPTAWPAALAGPRKSPRPGLTSRPGAPGSRGRQPGLVGALGADGRLCWERSLRRSAALLLGYLRRRQRSGPSSAARGAWLPTACGWLGEPGSRSLSQGCKGHLVTCCSDSV